MGDAEAWLDVERGEGEGEGKGEGGLGRGRGAGKVSWAGKSCAKSK